MVSFLAALVAGAASVNAIIELLKQTKGTVFVYEDGIDDLFQLLPALTEPELELLEARMPCPIPPDISELLRFTNGFNVGGGIEEVGFSGLQGGFGMEEIFPHSIPLAADGFGNYWVLDLTSESRSWGPIFYACHDAPVIVYRTDSPLHFVQEAIRFGNKP